MAVVDQFKKNKKKKKLKNQKNNIEPERVDKLKGKKLHEWEGGLASKKKKKAKKQNVAAVNNDAEMGKLTREELHEGERALESKKKKKAKKRKTPPVDNDMEMDKLKSEELHEREGALSSMIKKKLKKKKTIPVDDDVGGKNTKDMPLKGMKKMGKLNGEELHEGERDLESKKKGKGKKRKTPPVDNDMGERSDNTMEMDKLESEELREGEGALSSKIKKKLKKKKTIPVDDDVGGKNTMDMPLKGMKKWLLDYHGKRPGIDVLMQEIDEFIVDHEGRLEKERKEREAAAAAEGWTVVVHQKGRKKTVDAESGIAVGSVAEAAAKMKSAKKKSKEVDVVFYRFQRREARRNEIMDLQKKFEEDKKRIAQMRADRKFRPY